MGRPIWMIGLLSVGLLARPAQADVRLASVQSCSTVKLFERCELTVQLEGAIRNPYDPEEVALDVTFHPPKGQPVTVSGFYYQPFAWVTNHGREELNAVDPPTWKVRFTPRQLGRWTSEVQLRTPSGTHTRSAEPFLVVTSSHRGFVQFDRRKGQFRFETGGPFVPIGENLAWGPSILGIRSYDQWFRDLSRQRANYIRVWMAPWFSRLETKETGAGRYDQQRAWYMDYLFEHSESAGLYWQLCLLNHGSFSRSQDPDWDHNPYNVALGGMCRLPNEFLTSPQANAMFRRLLRYMVSRWGYSPQLTTWELFNEADFGEFRMEDLVSWTDQMSHTLHELDPYGRAVTTSFHGEAPPAVWRLPFIDAIQLHVYDQRDFPEVFGGPMISTLKQTFRKPVFIGEFGWIVQTMRQIDDIGIHFHDGLWASVMGGAYGGALMWYWDSYVHPNHLERHLRALEAFLRDEWLGLEQQRLDVSCSDGRLVGFGIGTSDRLLLWIKNRAHNVDQYLAYRTEVAKQRLLAARGAPVQSVAYAPGPIDGVRVTLKGPALRGRYRLEWWDPYRGRILRRSMAQARWGAVTVEVPSVTFDLAAKLIRLQWWERLGGSP